MENQNGMKTYPPTPEELRQYLRDHNVNGHQAAEMLQVSRRSVGHWMSGRNPIPYSAWFALRTMVEGEPPTDPTE